MTSVQPEHAMPLNIDAIWEFLTDDDDDLTSGDLGLVDHGEFQGRSGHR